MFSIIGGMARPRILTDEQRRKRTEEKRRRQRQREKNIKIGFCVYCNNKAIPTLKSCFSHWLREKSSFYLGTRTRWKELLDMLESQEYKCPFTGVLLVPGDNASIDHIIPKSKGGTNDIINLQWVDFKYNTIKNDMSNDEFMDYIKMLYERNIK